MPYKNRYRSKSTSVKKRPGRYTKSKHVKPSPKRTYAKRKPRTFGARRSSGIVNGTKYFHHRLTIAQKVQVLPTTGDNSVVAAIALMKNRIATSPDFFTAFNQSSRWSQIYNNYEEYAVTSCKVEYIPAIMSTASSTAVVVTDDPTESTILRQSCVENHRCWEDLDQGYEDPIDVDTAVTSPGFVIRNPNRRWKKYFNLRSLANSQNVGW